MEEGVTRSVTRNLKLKGTNDMLPTVEVDYGSQNDAAMRCFGAVYRALATMAASKAALRATIYVYEGTSINFGSPTSSIWFGVAAPEKTLTTLFAVLGSVSGIRVRYGEYVHALNCHRLFHVESGVVWRDLGGDEWGEGTGGIES